MKLERLSFKSNLGRLYWEGGAPTEPRRVVISAMSSVPSTARQVGDHTTKEDTGGPTHPNLEIIRMLAGHNNCTGLRSELSIRSLLVQFLQSSDCTSPEPPQCVDLILLDIVIEKPLESRLIEPPVVCRLGHSAPASEVSLKEGRDQNHILCLLWLAEQTCDTASNVIFGDGGTHDELG